MQHTNFYLPWVSLRLAHYFIPLGDRCITAADEHKETVRQHY
jgi:hypothetical protein